MINYKRAIRTIEVWNRETIEAANLDTIIVILRRVSRDFKTIMSKSVEHESKNHEKRRMYTNFAYKKRMIKIESHWAKKKEGKFVEQINKTEFEKLRRFLKKVVKIDYYYLKERF